MTELMAMTKQDIISSIELQMQTTKKEITLMLAEQMKKVQEELQNLAQAQKDTQTQTEAEWGRAIRKLTQHLPGERVLTDLKKTTKEIR